MLIVREGATLQLSYKYSYAIVEGAMRAQRGDLTILRRGKAQRKPRDGGQVLAATRACRATVVWRKTGERASSFPPGLAASAEVALGYGGRQGARSYHVMHLKSFAFAMHCYPYFQLPSDRWVLLYIISFPNYYGALNVVQLITSSISDTIPIPNELGMGQRPKTVVVGNPKAKQQLVLLQF